MADNATETAPRHPLVEKLLAKLPGLTAEIYLFRGDATVTVPADRLLEVMKVVRNDLGFELLVDIGGIHYPGRAKCFEVAYVVRDVRTPARFRVKVQVAEDEPVPSLTSLWPGANWHEREAYDLLGIRFAGHPDLTRIFMPDEFKDHPLRKEFPVRGRDQG
jgi:NADH-quinone oxidoreductase subunit C